MPWGGAMRWGAERQSRCQGLGAVLVFLGGAALVFPGRGRRLGRWVIGSLGASETRDQGYNKQTLEALLYTNVFWGHMSASLRVCRFGYQILKSVSKYPLGLKLYPRPCPRVQTQTQIRAQRVRYPRICGFFLPVAIFSHWR